MTIEEKSSVWRWREGLVAALGGKEESLVSFPLTGAVPRLYLRVFMDPVCTHTIPHNSTQFWYTIQAAIIIHKVNFFAFSLRL